MNESKHSRRPSLRLICRVVRQWESSCGSVEGQTWVAERHMETCDACQAFFTDDLAFEQSLRREALTVKSTPDAGFDLRIMQAVRESLPEREPRAGRARSFGFSLAAVAAGVALALVVMERNVTPENNGPVLAASGQDARASGALATVADWFNSEDARSSALELVESNPLQQEIDSISTDAQSVIGFLAMNFLPSEEGKKVLEKQRGSAGSASQG